MTANGREISSPGAVAGSGVRARAAVRMQLGTRGVQLQAYGCELCDVLQLIAGTFAVGRHCVDIVCIVPFAHNCFACNFIYQT